VQRLGCLNVLLRAIDDTDEAKLQRVHASGENVHGIGAVVHQVQLCQDANRPLAHGIDMAGQLQRLRVHEIDVGRGDGEDDTVGLRDVLGDEVARLLLDVGGLVANGNLQPLAPSCAKLLGTHLGQAGQVDQRQAEHVRRVDLEVDGLPVDALVVSCDPGRLVLDLAPDLGEVVVSPPGDVQELAPFLLPGDARGGVGDVDLVVLVSVFALAGQVDELEDERASGHDAAASGQKVSADNVFEHRRLSG
jgi:hypothetical protein